MAKLNKMEISAIADKIYSDFKKTSQYKLAVQTTDITKQFNEVFGKIPKKRGYSNISMSTYTIEDICESVWEDDLELKQLSIDKSDIERDIINLTKLKERIKKAYMSEVVELDDFKEDLKVIN